MKPEEAGPFLLSGKHLSRVSSDRKAARSRAHASLPAARPSGLIPSAIKEKAKRAFLSEIAASEGKVLTEVAPEGQSWWAPGRDADTKILPLLVLWPLWWICLVGGERGRFSLAFERRLCWFEHLYVVETRGVASLNDCFPPGVSAFSLSPLRDQRL